MFDESDLIFKYTDEMAVEDGYLVDLDKIFPKYKDKGLFKYATSNLMNQGYIAKHELKRAALYDLLIAAQEIVRKQSDNFKELDHVFKGEVELPSGETTDIFIAQNETGRLTLMLPEDY